MLNGPEIARVYDAASRWDQPVFIYCLVGKSVGDTSHKQVRCHNPQLDVHAQTHVRAALHMPASCITVQESEGWP